MIKNFIIKLISIIIPVKILNILEVILDYSLGKGFSLSLSNEIQSVRKFLKSKDVKIILDIGANYGNYTIELLKHFPKSTYYLFEPGKLPYEHLQKKFMSYPNIKLFNNAISDTNSTQLLYYDKKGSGLSSLHKRKLDHFNIQFDEHEEVKLISLNTLFENEFSDKSFKIDFCKIDIEGHELTVLNSIKNNFDRFKLIQFEFGGCNIDSRTYFQDFWYLLKDNFDIYRISPKGPILIKKYSERDEAFVMTNYLAVNKN